MALAVEIHRLQRCGVDGRCGLRVGTATHIVQTGASDTMSEISPELATSCAPRPMWRPSARRGSPLPSSTVGRRTRCYAFDAATLDEVFDLGAVDGDLDSLSADGIAVSAEHAMEQGWTIGSTVPATFPSGDSTMVVEALYSGGTDWVGSAFVDLDALRANGGNELDHRDYVAGDEAAITAVAAAYAFSRRARQGRLPRRRQLRDRRVARAVLRTAAAGRRHRPARHRQHLGTVDLRAHPRARAAQGGRHDPVAGPFGHPLESIIIAVFGTTIGLAIGTVFGWAVVRALADEGLDTLTCPRRAWPSSPSSPPSPVRWLR